MMHPSNANIWNVAFLPLYILLVWLQCTVFGYVLLQKYVLNQTADLFIWLEQNGVLFCPAL